jgi:hypothetical protein
MSSRAIIVYKSTGEARLLYGTATRSGQTKTKLGKKKKKKKKKKT